MTRARFPVLAAIALAVLGASVASLSLAQNPGAAYILAPSTRTVAPARVITTFPSNYDFVHPGDTASESAHGFQESGGSATSTATVLGRSIASGAGAWISYTLRVPQNQPFSLRIDDVGSERGVYEYSVQVNGTTVHTRSFACHIGWGKTYGGCQSYTFDLPSSYSSTGDVTVRFTWASGSPARIAAVWALGSAALPDPARGGTVSGMAGLPAGSATITSNSSASGAPYILYDFGVPMCGTFSFSYSTTGSARVKVARSNSRAYAGIAGDGVSDTGPLRDESRDVDLSGSGSVSYFPPGSDWTFRYVMLMLCTPGTVTISNVRMAYEAVPNMANPASYRGYFYCNDTALNRVWYAGAYTAQTCTREYLLDGGKRDRSLWGGDLEAAGPTVLLSYYDIAAVRDGYRKFFGPGDGWYWPGQDPVTGYLNVDGSPTKTECLRARRNPET